MARDEREIRIFPTSLYTIRFVFNCEPRATDEGRARGGRSDRRNLRSRRVVNRQTPKIRKTLRYVRWFVSVWLLLDFFLIILSAAAFGGAPGLALLLFVPIIVLLLAMRSVSGSTGRLVLLIFVLIFGVLQVLTTGGLVFLGAVLVALF